MMMKMIHSFVVLLLKFTSDYCSVLNLFITCTRYVSESGDFKNVMNSKCFQLCSFNTYEHNVYIKAFRFFTFNTLKTKVLLPENNIIQMTTIPP